LDIVVAPEDLPRLEKVLLEADGVHVVNVLQHESTCYYFVLALPDGKEIRFLPVDAATDYRRDGRVWFTAEELLKGRRRWKEFWVAAPEVEFKYLLVKKILKGSVPEHSAKRLRELVRELGGKSQELAVKLLGNPLGEQAVRWIETGALEEFQHHIPMLQKVLKRKRLSQDPLNAPRYWLREIPRIWQRLRYPTGLFVAVLGPDGSGKSTLINHLQREIKGAFRRTAIFHLMPGPLRKGANGRPVTDPHGKPPRSLPASVLKLFYYLLDYNLGYWLKVRPGLVKSTLVLFDRYYDDLLVDPKRYRYGGPMGLARWLRRLMPRPDLWLILDVPEEEILRRKQEVPPEEIRNQREPYRRLATELPNAFLLDGTLPPEEVARQAREIVLEYLHERYLSRRLLWFPKERRDHLGWLETALGARKASRGRRFLNLALPDGRGYLVPVNSRRATVHALSLYAPQKPKARLAKSFLLLGLKTGIAQRLLSEVRLDLDELRGVLEEVFGRRDFSLAVSLGTPGAHRKPVLQVLTEKGEVLGYVKVGWNEATGELVRNEARTLKALEERALPFDVPRVLYFGELGDRVLCVQSPPPIGVRPAPRQLTAEYVKVVCSIAEIGLRWQPLEQTAFWQRIRDTIQKVESAYWRHLLFEAVDAVREQWKGQKVPLHFAHGDFVPWNAFRINARLYFYDWEYAQDEPSAGYDLFHFMVQTAWLVDSQRPQEIAAFVLKWADDAHLSEYWERPMAKSKSLQALFELYLLDRLKFLLVAERNAPEKMQFIYHIWSEVRREA
jgi:thymidylate kinase